MRRVLALSGLLGMLTLTGMLFMGPASATVTPGCYGTVNTRDFVGITSAAPLRIQEGDTLNVQAGAHLRSRLYIVRIAYFGIRYAIRAGTTTDNQWSGSFNASTIFTRGTGNYIVEGLLSNNNVGVTCYAVLYVKVNGRPLGEPLGQAAAGVTAAGFLGMLASAVTGGKVPPGFEQTSTPEDEKEIEEHQEDEKKNREKLIKEEKEGQERVDEIDDEVGKLCFVLVLPALILTAGMVAAGGAASAGGAAPGIRRVRWRPRLSLVGIGSGVLFALGTGVLLQQYGVIWPTLGMGIFFLAGGLALGVMVPTLARLRVVRRINRRLESRERRSVPWAATHNVPEGGLSAWEQPDPSTEPSEDLAAGVPVQLAQRSGDWALVVAETGWSGWVNARLLEQATAASEPAQPELEEAAPPADWYPDPTGEARLRYWDGEGWTEHTSE